MACSNLVEELSSVARFCCAAERKFWRGMFGIVEESISVKSCVCGSLVWTGTEKTGRWKFGSHIDRHLARSDDHGKVALVPC